jgi:ribosomal protein S18 acetylase RimI-like enzyme
MSEGIRALQLKVERTNVTAQQVYRRAGFVDHDRYVLTKRLNGPYPRRTDMSFGRGDRPHRP